MSPVSQSRKTRVLAKTHPHKDHLWRVVAFTTGFSSWPHRPLLLPLLRLLELRWPFWQPLGPVTLSCDQHQHAFCIVKAVAGWDSTLYHLYDAVSFMKAHRIYRAQMDSMEKLKLASAKPYWLFKLMLDPKQPEGSVCMADFVHNLAWPFSLFTCGEGSRVRGPQLRTTTIWQLSII